MDNGKVNVVKRTEIYADAEEKYLKNTVLYGKSDDDYLYFESGCTNKIDKDTLMNLLLKGVLVSYGGAYYAPVLFKENAGAVEVTIATVINAASTASVVLYSSEHTAG